MKEIAFAALAALVLVAAVALHGLIWPDMSRLHDEADLVDLVVIETKEGRPHREGLLQLTAEDEAILREWLGTLRGLRTDMASYAPVLTLQNKAFSINFQESRLIINFAPSAGASMWQVSRTAQPEDTRMADWLRSKLPAQE